MSAGGQSRAGVTQGVPKSVSQRRSCRQPGLTAWPLFSTSRERYRGDPGHHAQDSGLPGAPVPRLEQSMLQKEGPFLFPRDSAFYLLCYTPGDVNLVSRICIEVPFLHQRYTWWQLSPF